MAGPAKTVVGSLLETEEAPPPDSVAILLTAFVPVGAVYSTFTTRAIGSLVPEARPVERVHVKEPTLQVHPVPTLVPAIVTAVMPLGSVSVNVNDESAGPGPLFVTLMLYVSAVSP